MGMKSQNLNLDDDDDDDPMSAMSRMVVAQICESVGFKGADRISVLETLADIAGRHLRAIAASAVASANTYGRTQPNLFDIVVALEHLQSLQGGFRGAASKSQSLLVSSTLSDIIKFVKCTDQIPFPKPILHHHHDQLDPYNSGGGGDNCCTNRFPPHIPRWLPVVPDMKNEKSRHHRLHKEEERRGSSNVVVDDDDGEKSAAEAAASSSSSLVVGIGLRNNKHSELLPLNRQRVRFKMGVVVPRDRDRDNDDGERKKKNINKSMMIGIGIGGSGLVDNLSSSSGFCRGVGGGKRISCQYNNIKEDGKDEHNDDDDDNNKKKQNNNNKKMIGFIKLS